MADTNHTDIDREDRVYRLRTIRQSLHIGLAAFGEIERLQNSARLLELSGAELPDDCKAMHPTGASDTVIKFSDALRFLDELEEAV